MLSDLAFDLARQGERVTVITSRQRYDAPNVALPAKETIDGVEIFRVWTSRFGRQNLIGRSADYLSFYVTAAWTLLRLARRGDIVIAKTDPPMLSVIAAPIARLRGARLVNWLQDIFPEVAEALGVGGGSASRLAFGLMRRLRNRSLRRAAINVAIGDGMADRLRSFGIAASQIRVIPNWADGQTLQPVAALQNPLRATWQLSGKFAVGYSGNLGRAHEYETLLDAIKHIESAQSNLPGSATTIPQIVWLFIGGGALFEEFKRAVQTRSLKSVQFQPYQPRDKLAESLSAADVHLVSLRPELEGLIVPSKFYGVAAVGRPTVFIGAKNGEISRLLARAQCGNTVQTGDGAELAKTILALAENPENCAAMGANARRMFDNEFDKPIAMARWRSLLQDVCNPSTSI